MEGLKDLEFNLDKILIQIQSSNDNKDDLVEHREEVNRDEQLNEVMEESDAEPGGDYVTCNERSDRGED